MAGEQREAAVIAEYPYDINAAVEVLRLLFEMAERRRQRRAAAERVA